MQITRITYQVWLPVLILFIGFTISYIVFAQGGIPEGPSEEEIAASGISFPVPELGNCGSKGECKRYCEEPANLSACIDFAKRHGLMNDEEVERARNFSQVIRSEGGPGGCKSPKECETFCRDINNIETCIAFADENNIRDKHIDQGRKILNFIRAGGQMPGGCNSKDSCDAYCGDFSHAEECFNFAKRVGIFQEGKGFENERDGGGPQSEEQFRKFLELAKNNQTPGSCKSKEQCESYCRSEGNFEECIAFGEKMGFVKPEQAELFRKTRGRGPGDCNSENSCRDYCNDPSHQDECFRFAEEHGLIPKEELERAKEGFVRLRQGLENAPPEVAECMRSVMGQNILDDIQSGKLVPGPEIGERVRSCFERHGESHDPRSAFENAPPKVISCIEEKLGKEIFGKIRKGESFPTPEMGDVFRVCFQEVQVFQGGEGFGGPQGQFGGPRPEMLQNFLRTAPPEIAACLKERLGSNFESLVKGEGAPGPDLQEKLKACFESFKPQMPPEGFRLPQGEFAPGYPRTGISPSGLGNLPAEVVSCVKGALGPERFESVLRGEDGGRAELEPAIKKCFEGLKNVLPQPASQPAPTPTSGVCPAMPTVNECPTGQIKKVSFSSPECGTYYTCVFEGNNSTYDDQYRQQYEEQYKLQYEEQYQQQYEQYQTAPPPGGNLLEAFKPLLFFFVH